MYASKRKEPRNSDQHKSFSAALIPNIPIYLPFWTEPVTLLTIPPLLCRRLLSCPKILPKSLGVKIDATFGEFFHPKRREKRRTSSSSHFQLHYLWLILLLLRCLLLPFFFFFPRYLCQTLRIIRIRINIITLTPQHLLDIQSRTPPNVPRFRLFKFWSCSIDIATLARSACKQVRVEICRVRGYT